MINPDFHLEPAVHLVKTNLDLILHNMAKVPPPNSCLTVKRGPSTSLSGSSSEGENSDLEVELEDVPPSPCSSTSSGPIYVRPAGFKHHAQEIQTTKLRTSSSVKLKKKIRKNTLPMDSLVCHQGFCSGMDKNNNNNNNNLAAVPSSKSKPKARKDPLPMKLRALPQSFWQQPNIVDTVPPGSMYTVLPPVSKSDQPAIGEFTDLRPITPTLEHEEKEYKQATKSERLDIRTKTTEKPQPQETLREGIPEALSTESLKTKPPKPPPRRVVRVSASSSNLLAKLFDGIDKDKKSTVTSSVRRGRPKRDGSQSSQHKHLVGDDPYMIDAVADGLLPLLSIESNRQSVGPTSHLSVVSVKDGDKTLTLPSLSIEQNYPAMLSELVKAL